MPAILTSTFRSSVAKSLLNSIQYGKSKYFHFVGKVASWNVSDTTPVDVTDTYADLTSLRNEIVMTKRIDTTDVSLVIDRVDWALGTVYTMWDSSVNVNGTNFYVYTTDKRVYKCIYNGSTLDNPTGIPSTVMPTGNLNTVFTTADGYQWKYMYKVDDPKEKRFLTTTHLPVQQAVSDRFYNNGGISQIAINSGGSGYPITALATTLQVVGTTGAGANIKVSSVGAGGAITGFNIINGGSGYINGTNGARLTITSASGTGFVGNVNVSGGIITSITNTFGGSGYAVNDIVNVNVGLANLIPSIDASGSIQNVVIVDGGVGHTSNPVITVVDPSHGGSGKYGATATFVGYAVNGVIQRVSVVDPGINYPSSYSAACSVAGDGSGAALTPIFYNGSLIDVVIDNPGTGYTYANITFSAASGSGAAVSPVFVQSDFNSDQSIVEQSAIDGAIHTIKVTDGGGSYSSATVTITGDGTGCTAVASLNTGRVVKITVTNPGYGYTYATVTITGDNLINNPLATNAQARVIFSPPGGHGFNAIDELYARTLSVYSNLRGLLDSSIRQDYRQYGLIQGLTDYITGAEISARSVNKGFISVKFTSTVGLAKDQILSNANASFRVLNFSSTDVNLLPLSNPNISPVGTLTDTNANAYTCTNIVSYPDFNKYSGQVIYFSDDPAFAYTDTQSTILKTFIRF